MNKDQLRSEIERDEGRVNEVYKCTMGVSTFGVGHAIKKTDPEWGFVIGTKIDESRIDQAFEEDIDMTLNECCRLYPDFYDLPEEVQLIIANMMFNLGTTRLSKFKGMKAGVDARDWEKAADEMVDSRWYGQVGNRSKRLVARMRAVK